MLADLEFVFLRSSADIDAFIDFVESPPRTEEIGAGRSASMCDDLPMTGSIEIRRGTVGDATAVAACHHRCFLKTFADRLQIGAVEAPDAQQTREQLHTWLTPGSGVDLRVATLDERVVGYCAVSANRVVHLFVDPAYQGTGIGRRLLTVAEGLLSNRGHRAFELHTRVENHDAIAFYEHAGWTMTERTIRTMEHGTSYLEHVLVKDCPPDVSPRRTSTTEG